MLFSFGSLFAGREARVPDGAREVAMAGLGRLSVLGAWHHGTRSSRRFDTNSDSELGNTSHTL
jgi:hypothetical protein